MQYKHIFVLLFWITSFSFFGQTKKTRKEVISILNESGTCFINLDNQKSLNLAKKALEYAVAIEDNDLIAKSYNIIGLNFDDYADSNKAIEFYEKGLKHANLTENDSVKQWLYNNLASVYSYRKIDINKSIIYYKKALNYATIINDVLEINYIKENLALAYFSDNKYNIGKIYLDEIGQFVINRGEIELEMKYYSLLGEYYNYLKNDELTEKYYLKAVEISKQNKVDIIDSHIAEFYIDFSKFYFKKNDFEKAYYYLNQGNLINEKIYNQDKVLSIKDAQISIELDEYKREIDRMDEENKSYVRSLNITKTINILLFSLCIIIGILFLLLYKNQKIRKALNTKLEIQNSKLEKARNKAEENASIKSQFVSTVTHEIRTPLYGIIGLIDLLVEENKEFKNNQKIKSLSFSANYLLMLINDILQTNKLETNNLALENIKFSISQVFKKVINSLQYLAKQNNNKIVLSLDKDFPKYIYGDKTKFLQIVMNLLTNALKFTNNGVVNIVLQTIDKTDKEINFNVIIEDNGIGISQNEQKLIFNKFIQLNRKQTDYQGTGLGLFIVKSLTDILNGKINLESEEGKGTKITVNLKFNIINNTVISKLNKSEIKKSNQKINILIVEDNKINRLVTSKVLEKNNFKCKVAENGYEALSEIQKHKFDIILMDINMPGINGFETAKLIKKSNQNLPIIALTATDVKEIKNNITQSEIDEVIVKPFDENDLIVKIHDLLNKFDSNK